jgi:hypothetical protein
LVTNLVELGALRCAELVAPAVSRAFVSGMRAGGDGGRELVARYGGGAIGYVIDLRNPLAAGRSLSTDDLAAVYRYSATATRNDTIEASVSGGLLERDSRGSVSATKRGMRFLAELYEHHRRVLGQRWDRAVVDRLNPLLERLLGAAASTGGAAWAAQAPPFEPDGEDAAVVLLNRLSTMRYHRADAHAAAWQTAGWTAADVAAMPWGTPWNEARSAIEHDTNVRAAPPYEALKADERLTLIAGLAALA